MPFYNISDTMASMICFKDKFMLPGRECARLVLTLTRLNSLLILLTLSYTLSTIDFLIFAEP